MADVTVKHVDDMEPMFGGGMLRTRASLGVSSFGMQVINLPPNWSNYPNHNHAGEPVDDGQEEIYTVLSGSATLIAGGEEHLLVPGVFARVGPSEKRKIVTASEPAQILTLGGTPGRAYQVQDWTELGASEPQIPELP